MAKYTVKRKTLILKESESNGTFTYISGEKEVYINSVILRNQNQDKTKTISPINGCYIIYFSSDSETKISTNGTEYTYDPVDKTGTELYKQKEYKRLDMMIDDDTSYSILRVNPKLTGNVKVVIDSDSNLYLDTFKVSLGLSQNKYRHIPINPMEYYGRTLMTKMRSIPTDDFYKIEESCYDLFATANDFDDQYYDKYNYGVRTNTDKMYHENYSLLAPLCVRNVLPDFFLIFKIKDYESLFDNGSIEINDRTKFIDFNNCELIKSFDFREGTNLGTYIRTILKNNKTFVGDLYTGSDYDHFNIFNGISVERGVVSNIYEETSYERSINNQVSMNDWYTLGFQRNHIVSKDIINFEFMFDDTSEKLFSLPTYFGVYVRLNGEEDTFTCIDVKSGNAVFDSSIHGLDIGSIFDPSQYPTIIYGLSTDEKFIRLNKNISQSEEAKSHKLETYKSIVTVDTYDISNYNDGSWTYVSNKLNDVLDPGEHYRILDPTNNIIYEVIVSNFFSDVDFSDISYTQADINGASFQIIRISILNTEYRSNIEEKDKSSLIKYQLNLLTKAFNKLSDKIKAYDDNESSFSILYKRDYPGSTQKIMFEKISSICGFNKANDDIIKDPSNGYVDNSSYIFGCDCIEKMIIDPTIENFDNIILKTYYPIGFEILGTRVAYCVDFMDIVSKESGETMVLINDDIQKSISSYKTVLYTTKFNENKIYNKNIHITYASIEGDNTIVSKKTDLIYSVIGFGSQKSYFIKFEITPLIKTNNKLQFYKNFPMNAGICSIFPLKDYYFDVLDHNSVFFTKNESNESESIKIDGNKSEYSKYDKNAYQKSIIDGTKSEELISDYCDKFRTYNTDSSGLGYMKLDSENELGLFLSNMQKNGHNKFDVSLISPYCCKWRIVGTDMTGGRMRIMYNLTNPKRKSYVYDSSTWVDGYIDMDGTIHKSDQYKASPYIDISEYKDIRVDEGMKGYIDSVGYFFGSATKPTILWYEPDRDKPFVDFNTDLLNSCSYIRISIREEWVTNYDNIRISLYKKNDTIPYLTEDTSSYWIPSDDDDHIGFLSYDLKGDDNDSSCFTKYISDLYDEDETGSFNQYIYRENGSIDDILYRQNNIENKFSKIYKYGDNSIEFVSCGVKIRIKSTDKSMINLSRYVGYSVILISMSGNNSNQPGTYELFIDETKEQAALVVYNGIYSENNRINYITDSPGVYRVKHSSRIADAKYDNNNGVIIDDDGFIFDVSTGLIGSKMFIVSKPTNDGYEEIIGPKQIVLSGNISKIENKHITLSSATRAIGGVISNIYSQEDINPLSNKNNNVDAYIITTSKANIATHSLSVKNLKDLTQSYSISIKTENETKKYNNVSSILSISIVDPFEIKREDSNYETLTTGYIHPSYAVPVMNDIFKFDYKASDIISDSFKTWFDGCNIMISDILKINQTWMKKVIDIDNTMKQEKTEYHQNVIVPFIRYTITSIPFDGSTYVYEIETKSKYKESISNKDKSNDVHNDVFIVETFTPDETTAVEERTNLYEIFDQELRVHPINDNLGKKYHKWKSKYHSLIYNNDPTKNNFKTVDLEYDDLTKTYRGNMILENIGQSREEVLSVGEKMRYVSKILIGTIDTSSNTSIITNLQYNDKLFGKTTKDGSTAYTQEFYYDGTIINENTGKTMLSLRTDTDIENNVNLQGFYFSTSKPIEQYDKFRHLKFDDNYIPNYYREDEENGVSNILSFTIKNIVTTTETKYKKANIQIRCNSSSAVLHNSTGILKPIDDQGEVTSEFPDINFSNAQKQDTSRIDDPVISKYVDQSSSVTLLRNNDPLIGYWYTDICRLFSKYDTYISYYGAFSGFEKNNYIASRGITLKTKDQDGNIIHGIDLTTWIDSIVSQEGNKITLNITTSIINFINSSNENGYSESWNKNQKYINSGDISYSSYKSKYIENTILKLIDINNNTKFILYVDKSSDVLEFAFEKPADTSRYEEMSNIENTLVFSENRYYMNIENLEPHRYYAEMIINF